MKFIKLTSLKGEPIYVNMDHIGHFYHVPAVVRYGHVSDEEEHTRVCVTTHNNGGLKVKEAPTQILTRMEHYIKI
jgi:hypothetical protein